MLQELKKSNSAIFAISDKEQIKSEKSILELVEELKVLNQRWEKSNQLDESGFYLNKSPEYQERVCTELRKICSRATDIWEYLAEVSPERLEGLYLLEKID